MTSKLLFQIQFTISEVACLLEGKETAGTKSDLRFLSAENACKYHSSGGQRLEIEVSTYA